METKTWFRLFTSCKLVRGYKTSLLYDLERSEYYQITNLFASILDDLKTHDLNTYVDSNELNEEDFYSFINQFIKEELGFLTKHPEQFPNMDLSWDSPYPICNAIIEIGNKPKFCIDSILDELTVLGCQAIQFQFKRKIELFELKNYLKKLNNSSIRCAEVTLPYNSSFEKTKLEEILIEFPVVRLIHIYDYNQSFVEKHSDKFLNNKITYSTLSANQLNDEVITKNSFIFNIPNYSEAQNLNIGLNRKVCICTNGDVKNFLSHRKSFGNINQYNLKKIIGFSAFKEKWTISNDKIEKCKDCQFRYACLSNSDILKKDNKYYKVNECGYNPYENTWQKNTVNQISEEV